MKAAASMAAPLAVGELTAPLKTNRDVAAAAQETETQAAAVAVAATAAAKTLLGIFAVAEHGDFEVQFCWVRLSSIRSPRPEQVRRPDERMVLATSRKTQDKELHLGAYRP